MKILILIVLFAAGSIFVSFVEQDPCHSKQSDEFGYALLAIQNFGKVLSLMNPRAKSRNVPRCEMLAGIWLLNMNVERTELSGSILLKQVMNETGLSGDAEINVPSSNGDAYRMYYRVRLTYEHDEWLLIFTPANAKCCRQFEFLNHSFEIRSVNFDSIYANVIRGYMESRYYASPVKFDAVRK